MRFKRHGLDMYGSDRIAVQRDAALIAYRAFSDVAGKGAFFLVTILAARRLSQEAFGIFSLGSTIGWMVAVATDFGMQLHVARASAQHPGDASRLFATWLRVRAQAAAAGFVLVVAIVTATRPVEGYSAAIVVFVLVYLTGGLVEFVHYFYRGLSRTDLESTFTLAWRAAMLACAAAALAWRPDVLVLAIALVVPAAATLAIELPFARRLSRARAAGDEARDPRARNLGTPEPWSPGTLEPRNPGSVWLELAHDVLPIGAGVVLSAIYFRIDVVLIDLWNGAAAVGLYNAVFRLVDGLRLMPAAVLAVMLPALCRATTTRPLLQLSFGLTIAGIVTAVALSSAAGWLVPFLYGAAYAAAVPAFRILLLSFPLMCLNVALTHQLIGWNGQRAYAAICASALVFNVALNARLIPTRSIAGAAWTTLWTEVLLTCGCVAALWIERSRQRASALTVSAAS